MLFLLIVIEINIIADRNGTDKNMLWNFSTFEEEDKYDTEHYRRFPLVI